MSVLPIAMALALMIYPVRAEPVEASSSAQAKDRPSTSSGRTEAGSAIEAERAFAADAQKIGQWAAFRKWAAPDATMFAPGPVKAQEWLKGRSEPIKAIDWLPAAAYVSCDGKVAATTGPWQRPDGSVGYFSTIWVRQPDGGWKWVVDHGDRASTSSLDPDRHAFDPKLKPHIERAACKGGERWGSPPQGLFAAGANDRDGSSPDGTLLWYWSVSKSGARDVRVALWNGHGWENAIWDRVGYPYQSPGATPRS